MINKKLLLVLIIMVALVGVSVSFSLLMSYNGIDSSTDSNSITEIFVDEEPISSTPILDRDNDKTETIESNTIDDVDMGSALLEKIQEDNAKEAVDNTEVIDATETTEATVADNTTDDTQIDDVESVDTAEDDSATTTSREGKKKKKKGKDGPGVPIAKFTIESQGTIVRSGPNADHPEIGSLPIGTTGEVIEKVNDYWVKINFNGDVGYIYSGYSKIEDL